MLPRDCGGREVRGGPRTGQPRRTRPSPPDDWLTSGKAPTRLDPDGAGCTARPRRGRGACCFPLTVLSPPTATSDERRARFLDAKQETSRATCVYLDAIRATTGARSTSTRTELRALRRDPLKESDPFVVPAGADRVARPSSESPPASNRWVDHTPAPIRTASHRESARSPPSGHHPRGCWLPDQRPPQRRRRQGWRSIRRGREDGRSRFPSCAATGPGVHHVHGDRAAPVHQDPADRGSRSPAVKLLVETLAMDARHPR